MASSLTMGMTKQVGRTALLANSPHMLNAPSTRVCEVLSRANEPLFDALNERGETEKEYDIETYGDLKRFIKDTE